jgi:hypothetical protein
LPLLAGGAMLVAGLLFGFGLAVYGLGAPRRKIRLRRFF